MHTFTLFVRNVNNTILALLQTTFVHKINLLFVHSFMTGQIKWPTVFNQHGYEIKHFINHSNVGFYSEFGHLYVKVSKLILLTLWNIKSHYPCSSLSRTHFKIQQKTKKEQQYNCTLTSCLLFAGHL